MTTVIKSGISLIPGDTYAFEPVAGDRPRTRSGPPGSTPPENIDSWLEDAGFEIAADLDLAVKPSAIAPGDTMDARPRSAPPRSKLAAPPGMAVVLTAEQDAVLLLEQEGGVFHWHWPDSAPDMAPQVKNDAPRSRGSRAEFFNLAEAATTREPPPSGARGIPFAGPILDHLTKPIRVRVLRFFANKTIDALMDRIEGDLQQGPRFWDAQADEWRAGLPDFSTLPGKKILLMVHGTFSTTANSFGGLATSNEGRIFLGRAVENYDAIIGFDHKTLALKPVENAQDMIDCLRDLPHGAQLDAVAFSRGGLVLRAFELAITKARDDIELGPAVFVGCTNAGTFLAHPDNWKALVDLYTTIAMASLRAASLVSGPAAVVTGPASYLIKTISRFVQALPQLAIEEGRVPGLKAMLPGGKDMAEIATPAASLARYRAIASDFRPKIDGKSGVTGEIVEFIADRVGDRFYKQANDLVVHTASMADFGAAGILGEDSIYYVDEDSQIFHTIYFSSDSVAGKLSNLLLDRSDG